MATILCFGDSNTWGISPAGHRYDESERWTSLLADKLANTHTIIEAGQPNRTLIHNAPFSVVDSGGNVSGIRYLKPYLEAHKPDVVMLMLGTNDLKKRFNLSAIEVAQGMYQLAMQTLNFEYADKNNAPKVIIISPPPIFEVAAYLKIYAGAAEKSQQLAKYYSEVAQKLNCIFFDAGSVIQSCSNEGIHWQAKQHALFAEAVKDEIMKLC